MNKEIVLNKKIAEIIMKSEITKEIFKEAYRKGRTEATQDFIKMINEFGEFRCGWCDGELCPNIPREELKQKLEKM